MTLCIAWIRKTLDTEELIFVTDSALTGGEKWNQGIKLFELPRPDCLLCFAGDTGRAYPLIQNLISTINLDKTLQDPHVDLTELLDHLTTLFTSLVSTIIDDGQIGTLAEMKSSAQFLFGGWSWADSRFRIWRVFYSENVDGFIFKEETDINKSRGIAFLGNPKRIQKDAFEKYKEIFDSQERYHDPLDMEPLRIIIDMSRDTSNSMREVDGAIQIAKIHKSGTTEFFGIYWPSIEGKPYFQGRKYSFQTKPYARYFDPDTLELIEDQLPMLINDISQFEHLEEYEFICDCYEQDGSLKLGLPSSKRNRLISIFRETAYFAYIEELKNKTS